MIKRPNLRFKPWDRGLADFPPGIFRAKGMIRAEERQCFYYLARHYLRQTGCIVDAGAFVGSSTLAFAAGAHDAKRRRFNGKPILHAYDYFEVIDDYVAAAIKRMFGREVVAGESYLDLFEQQLKPYLDMIEVHAGDFLTHRWGGDPIEILFIDIAKTEALNTHVLTEFFPSLVPGESLVIQQDYYDCWQPWIHLTMEWLADDFELVDEYVHGASRLWRLVQPISEAKIERVRRMDFSESEADGMFDRLLAHASYEMRPMEELIRLVHLRHKFRLEDAVRQVERIDRLYMPETSRNYWAQQFREVKDRVMQAVAQAEAGG